MGKRKITKVSITSIFETVRGTIVHIVLRNSTNPSRSILTSWELPLHRLPAKVARLRRTGSVSFPASMAAQWA